MLREAPAGYDGELLTYTNGVRDDFNTVQSKIMSANGTPDFRFHVFDTFAAEGGFAKRFKSLRAAPAVEIVPHQRIETAADLDAFERQCVEAKAWEGVMLRAPAGAYKLGRSTAREGILLKLKRFADDEATVVGLVEQFGNTNAATTNALGYTERSSAKDGLTPKGTLGALSCAWRGVQFEIGTGFDQATRDALWCLGETLIGTRVTFKYQGVGPNGRPRFPSFKSLRYEPKGN